MLMMAANRGAMAAQRRNKPFSANQTSKPIRVIQDAPGGVGLMSTAYTASAKQGCSTAATQQNYFSTVTRAGGATGVQANHTMQIPALSNSTDNNNGETHAALIDINSVEAQQHILNYSSDQNLLDNNKQN